MKVKVKGMLSYAGHGITQKGVVNLTLKANYSECTTAIQLLQMLNNDININVRKYNDEKIKLGIFRLKEVKFDGDGKSTIKLFSTTDFVETAKINDLIPCNDDPLEFTVLFVADVEGEENEE